MGQMLGQNSSITTHFWLQSDGCPPIRIPYIFMFFCNFVRLHKRKFSSNSKILFSLVCFCIDKRHAAYKKHMILVLSHNKGKLNRILELLENLILCNRISNKKTWDSNRWTIKVWCKHFDGSTVFCATFPRLSHPHGMRPVMANAQPMWN